MRNEDCSRVHTIAQYSVAQRQSREKVVDHFGKFMFMGRQWLSGRIRFFDVHFDTEHVHLQQTTVSEQSRLCRQQPMAAMRPLFYSPIMGHCVEDRWHFVLKKNSFTAITYWKLVFIKYRQLWHVCPYCFNDYRFQNICLINTQMKDCSSKKCFRIAYYLLVIQYKYIFGVKRLINVLWIGRYIFLYMWIK